MKVDLYDWLAIAGLLLVAAGLWLWLGLAAAVIFAGIVLIVLGVTGASTAPSGG